MAVFGTLGYGFPFDRGGAGGLVVDAEEIEPLALVVDLEEVEGPARDAEEADFLPLSDLDS